MIKEQDIRIGDIVKVSCDCILPEGSVCVVTQINTERFCKNRNGVVTLRYADGTDYVPWGVWCNSIEGIPLTPKILENNGFENIGDDTYQLEEKPCWFWVDFFNHQYGCEYDTSTHEYEDDEHRLKLYGIPSVHELQHALRLCGIEKEIEL